MKGSRKIGWLLVIILVVMQFIQPTKNISGQEITVTDISKGYKIPEGLHQTLIQKCYDCHSNNTRYPWYFNIQPIGWWLAAHVHDGKEHLNFSEFTTYASAKAENKLEEIGEVTEDRSMPLKAYVMFHENAALTDSEAKEIMIWLDSLGVKPD